MIEYKTENTIKLQELDSFFKDWKASPSPGARKKLVKGSDLIITARDNGRLVGILTAITDGILYVFITLVEVLDSHQGRGIGSRLIKLAISRFKRFYDIVLITDPDKAGFYSRFGFKQICGLHLQNFGYEKTSKKRKKPSS